MGLKVAVNSYDPCTKHYTSTDDTVSMTNQRVHAPIVQCN